MRYVAAYLLAVLGENAAPTAADIKIILESVGVSYDDERASSVISKLQGKDINEVRRTLLPSLRKYRKIPIISPGLILFQRPFLPENNR